MKNASLLGKQSVCCEALVLRSFWDVNGDHNYRSTWPRDRPLDFIEGAVVIVYTIQGKGTVVLKNGTELHLRGASLVFLDPLTISHYWCDSGYWKLYWIEIIPEKTLPIPREEIINIDNHAHYHIDFTNLISTLQQPDNLHKACAVSILNKMIYEWLLLNSIKRAESHEKVIHLIIDEMHHRLTDNWQVKEMAESAGFSEQYFRKIFKARLQVAPKQFFNELKLEVILGQLKTGTSTISQLAEKYGYTDAYHLSSAFKKKFGYPPSKVKTNNRIGSVKVF